MDHLEAFQHLMAKSEEQRFNLEALDRILFLVFFVQFKVTILKIILLEKRKLVV